MHQWCVLCHVHYSSIRVLLLLTLCMCQWYVSIMWAGLDGKDPHVLRTLPQPYIQHRGWRVQLQHGSGIHVGRGYHLLNQLCPDPHEVSQTFLISVVLIIRPSSSVESHHLHLCCPDYQLCPDPHEVSQTFLISWVTPSSWALSWSLALSWSSWSESDHPQQLSHTVFIFVVLIISFVLIFMKQVKPSSPVASHLPH